MRKLILIGGKAGSGKDTVATMLYNQLCRDGYESIILHFATPVKEIAEKQFNWDGIKDDRGRKLLQDIGDAGRNYDLNFWVKQLYEKLDEFESNRSVVIVPDFRYKNEVEYSSEYNLHTDIPFELITLKVIGNKESIESEELRKHSSENDLDDFRFECVIKNDSDIISLRDKVTEFRTYITYK